jgi:hypothetical protein
MRRRTYAGATAVALWLLVQTTGMAQQAGGAKPPDPRAPKGTAVVPEARDAVPTPTIDACATLTSPEPKHPVVKRRDDNTIVFNHRDLTAHGEHPYVLDVDDGEYFQVLFTCTAPWLFDYVIAADTGGPVTSVSATTLPQMVNVNPALLTARGVTMRHDAKFSRYHVTATVRDGVLPVVGSGVRSPAPTPAPDKSGTLVATGRQTSNTEQPSVPLYSVAFDIWVRTSPDWKLSVIAGVASSKLNDTKYSIATDPSTGAKAFQIDPTHDDRHLDVMALANVYYSRAYFHTVNLGAAFGIGTSGTTPRYFFGPSVVFGKYFVLTGGWALGSVTAPPLGQQIGAPPVNGDNTLNSLSSRVARSTYIGVGFTWIDRHDQFAAALTTASVSGGIGSCVTKVTPDPVTFTADGDASSNVSVEAGDDCTWTAVVESSQAGFSVTSGGTNKGKGTIVLHAAAPIAGGQASVLNVVGPPGSAPKTVKLTQGAPTCVTAVGTAKSMTFSGAKQSIDITAPADCTWTVSVDPASSKFVLDLKGDQTGNKKLTITPPDAGDADVTARLNVVGPGQAAPKVVTLTQPKKGA